MATTSTTISWALSCPTDSKVTAQIPVSCNTQIRGAASALVWVLALLVAPLGGSIQAQNRAGELNAANPAGATGSVAGQRLPPGVTNLASYVILVNDLIKVEVYKEDDLKRETRVDQDGTIKLPLIETVRVAGKTIASARELVKALYEKDYLRNADVAVTLIASSHTNAPPPVAPKLKFQVTGEVKKPGMIEIPENEKIDLVQAIGLAGDFTTLANKSSVRVRRTEGGKEKVYDEDVKKMLDGKSKPFPILPGDVITVRQTVF